MGIFFNTNRKCPIDGHLCACCVFWHGQRSTDGRQVTFDQDEWAKCDKSHEKIKGWTGTCCPNFKSQYK